jgi:hypothetical protein
LKRDRTTSTQQVLSKKISALQNARTAASSFLVTRRWQAFDNDVLELVGATQSHIETLSKNVVRSLLAHRRLESNFADKISDLNTVDASHTDLPGQYDTINSLLAESLPYKPHVVTAFDIDRWMDMNAKKQSDESRRKRKQQWREGLQLTVSCRPFKFLAGGPHTTIVVLWKIPSDAEDRDATKDLRVTQEAQKQLPHYMSRAQWGRINTKYSAAMGGRIPAGMLKHITQDIFGDSSSIRDKEQTNRLLRYCVSQGDDSLWPDLDAAACGSKN